MDTQTTATAIQKAIGAHAAWKLKFRVAPRTGALPAPVETIAADDQCAFGRLLAALAPELEGDPDFRAVRVLHADFHANAGRLAQVIVAGDSERVAFELGAGGSFEKRALALSARLADWRIKLKYRSGPTGALPVSRCCARN